MLTSVDLLSFVEILHFFLYNFIHHLTKRQIAVAVDTFRLRFWFNHWNDVKLDKRMSFE